MEKTSCAPLFKKEHMATAKYKSPIRGKRKVLFVYITPKNHTWLPKQLSILSASEFVNRLITFMREGEHDFQNIIPAVEGRRQNENHPKFDTPINPEAKNAS